MDTTSYTYDSLNRMASQTTAAGTSSFSYLGQSGELASEADPNSTSKAYDYTPGGTRLSQATTTSGTSTLGYYSYNAHSDVEALTGASGATTATYGYTAYGNPITSMFTGQDKNNATASPTSTTTPYSSYRFNAMRWDSSTGQYDMGFRNYDPSLNQFASRDMYNGALADAGLTTDPFTGSRYAFGNGNPISNIESNGHSSCPPPTINCGGSTSFSSYINQQGAATSGTSGLTQQQITAMQDLIGSFAKNVLAAPRPTSNSGNGGAGSQSVGSAICAGLVDLCSLPSAIANIPNIPSDLKQFGSSWLAGWRAGYSNQPVAWRENGQLNVTMPNGTQLLFGGIKENAQRGAMGEEASERLIQQEGLDYATQVTFKTGDGIYSRLDFLTRNAAQQLKFVESKTGNATLTDNQVELFEAISRGEDVYPVGQNAADFGLEPGKPVKISGGSIDFWEIPPEP
jgi:RHS repeat-associated protein